MRVCVLQADNRLTLDYLIKTQRVIKLFCGILHYEYSFVKIDEKYGNIHPATKKIYIINEFLKNPFDILVFLDSDAWIQNGFCLDSIIRNLIKSNKHGCFSRDPYLKVHTFINSGSFIIKNNEYIKQMYTTIIKDLESNSKHHNKWPFDQFYISNYIFKNKQDFVIFVPNILNTAEGKVLRHNWPKNQKMYEDLEKLLYTLLYFIKKKIGGKVHFNEQRYYDKREFPNKLEHGYEYKGILKDKKKPVKYIMF
uniref:Nucleotide-diphospho-sugar transferase domain-containing protein n=1 Tax=viral metagenome TaxID=1070528 RepID=A0A6C0HSJ1_9ZZZZ